MSEPKKIRKSKYGKNSEVINAHVQEIIGIPEVNGTNTKIIHEFYSKLVTPFLSNTMKLTKKLNVLENKSG